MKKIIAVGAVAALLSAFTMSSFAAGQSAEDMCKAQAEKQHISVDKLEAFVKTCVEKHAKGEGAANATKTVAPAPAAPASPATPIK